MILTVTKSIHQWALERPDFENDRTIKESGDSRGRYVGNLSEFTFAKFLRAEGIDHTPCGSVRYDYDFKIGNLTGDAKGKERTYSYQDLPNRLMLDEGHVKEDQENFSCDFYVFANVHIPKGSDIASTVQLVGWVPKARFWNKCQRVSEGEDTGGFIEQADAGKLAYSSMEPLHTLTDVLSNHLTKLSFNHAA